MKRIFTMVTAAVMAACTFSVLPQTTASAITNGEILEQQLTMPVISIDTLGNRVNTKESYTDAKITIWDETGTIDTDDANISIRLRGNSTLNLDKKSYRFKFPKKSNPLHLGDGSAKSWNLVANYYDTSLLRSMTAYHLGDMMDNMPYTPNSRSVEVYVNGSYQGVYLLCEAVNVAKSRIAITEDPTKIEDDANTNADSYNRNFTKWNTLGRKVYNETDEAAALKTHLEHAEYLANWLDQRITWLNNYYHSDAFTGGIFLDENNQEIDVKNAVIASALMFWGGSGTIDTDSPGFTAEASSGWWGGQALSTGIMLQEGQKYRLSFDYTAPSTASINYRIQANHDSYTPYLNGSVSANGTTQTFEKEFTADTTDFNCAIVLEFKGSGTVTVEHLSLVALESEPVRGDGNGDGIWNLSDVVALQKWILAVPGAELEQWKNVDFDSNGKIDVLDLCLMRRELML